MGLPNGVHHLAIATRDVKGQVEFFTQVCGMELVAMYWMHGVENTVHALLRLGDSSSIALVQSPAMQGIEPAVGVSHPGFTAGDVAGGAMQHVSFNVDTRAELLAMRDRLRARGHWVMGPIDHGMCWSIYATAPEGLMIEFSSQLAPIDADEWIDPEVVAACGISAEELARYRTPPPFESQNGKVPQPDPNAKPNFVFPEEWADRADTLFKMSDDDVFSMMSVPTPPVPKKRAVNE
jgi:catechol 2,3-dioxygenase-like lactoylglutathione lyase family enzyme